MSRHPAVPIFVERSLDASVDALDLLRLEGDGGRSVPGPRFYFAPRDGEPVVAACGSIARVVAEGPESAVVEMARHDPTQRGTWVGGFAFDPIGRRRRGARRDDPWHGFPPSLWLLPSLCLVRDADGAARLVVAGVDGVGVREALERSADRWAARLQSAADSPRGGTPNGVSSPVRRRPSLRSPEEGSNTTSGHRLLAQRLQRAITAVRRGDAIKVVLAVSQSRSVSGDLDPITLLEVLRRGAPGCTAFLIEPEPGRALLGATPERLLRLAGSRVSTMALAGSAARGETPDEDAALGAALMASDKEREEHRLVVAAITAALGGAGVVVAPTAPPRLRRLARIQHLETPIVGELHDRADLLSLASRLHPTPALGGEPGEAALALIRALEPEDRGWYGGAVGWRDGRGDGDLAVVIRALRLDGRRVTAFAGAGLVAASDPVREQAEIALKLEAAFAPLAEGAGRSESGGDSC